ncbi:ribonuclease H-like domain-containing protein [Tanacetum coccineum]
MMKIHETNECIDQEKDDNVNNTNNVNVASTNEVNAVGGKTSIQLPDDPNIPALEDINIFDLSRDDEDVGAEADMNNLDTIIQEEPKKELKDPTSLIVVYKVEKALYGLHQAPRAWYETLSTYLLDNRFERGKIDKTLFIKRHKVCACARYQVNSKVLHLHDVKRIFKYLKGQPKLVPFGNHIFSIDLVAYTDSDYAGASLDRNSTTGGCQFLGSRLISWQCKKQIVVANSTTKAEYVAASSCCG